MIAVRQAGSFHTGRSAQSPRRRKPISPVTSVAEGQEPRIHADSIRQVHPPAAMAPEAVDCGVPSGTRLLSPDVPASRAAAASSDRDPRHTGSTGTRGTCVDGPPTALAAVVPFGSVGTSACGPSMGRRTGEARTPCRARPRLMPSWRRGPPRADSHACTHRVQGDHFYEGLDGAAVQTLGNRAWGRAIDSMPGPAPVGFSAGHPFRFTGTRRSPCRELIH